MLGPIMKSAPLSATSSEKRNGCSLHVLDARPFNAFDNLIWPRLDTHIWPHLINKDGCPIRQSSSGFSQDGVQGKERRLSSFLCAAL